MCVYKITYLLQIKLNMMVFFFLLKQEHKCVLDSGRALEAEGFRVTYLPVQTNGLVDLKVRVQEVTYKIVTMSEN